MNSLLELDSDIDWYFTEGILCDDLPIYESDSIISSIDSFPPSVCNAKVDDVEYRLKPVKFKPFKPPGSNKTRRSILWKKKCILCSLCNNVIGMSYFEEHMNIHNDRAQRRINALKKKFRIEDKI